LTARGTADKPIVIRAAGDGEAIFDGDGAFRLFDVMAADYNIFEGLTIRNTEVAFWAGVKDVAGATGLVVRNCRIENVGVGINWQAGHGFTADNIFLGRDDGNGSLAGRTLAMARIRSTAPRDQGIFRHASPTMRWHFS
jgi:nitrous oxidase accessory protein NosD